MERAAIACDKCRHMNYFPIDRNTKCNKCEQPLFRKKGVAGKAMRKVLLIGGTFAAGAVAATVDLARDPGLQVFFRYPMAIEYEITERCVRSSGGYLNIRQLSRKTELCLCALQMTQYEFNYDRYKSEKKAMWASYQRSMRDCAMPQ